MSRDPLSILASALDDVGHWRYWAHDLPGVVQFEFGGVQLVDESKGLPSSAVVALRFLQPRAVAFLERGEIDSEDWPTLLASDRLDPQGLSHETATFDAAGVRALLDAASVVRTVHGPPWQEASWDAPAVFGLWAGSVGLAVAAESMLVLTPGGLLSLEDVLDRYDGWWTYWRGYWARRNTDEAYPWDFACEVTIPLK